MKKIYAFVRRWSPEREKPEALQSMQDRVRQLDAELLVLSAQGVWSFDDDAIEFCDQIAGDHVTQALLARVHVGRDAVFVVDEGALTFQQEWAAGDTSLETHVP